MLNPLKLFTATALVTAGAVSAHAGKEWQQINEFVPDDAVDNQYYGSSVDISETGGYLIIGSHKGKGVVLYRHMGGNTWLVPTLDDEGTSTGYENPCAAVSDEHVVIGAPHKNEDRGEAIFWRNNPETGWRLAGTMGENASAGSQYGYAVSIRGSTAAIGAPYRGDERGLLSIAHYEGAGKWAFQQTLQPHEIEAGDRFGAAVAMNSARIFVGAPGDNGVDSSGRARKGLGAVYVCAETDGKWMVRKKLIPSATGDNVNFGASIAAVDGIVATSGGSDGIVGIFEKEGAEWVEVFESGVNSSGITTPTESILTGAVAISSEWAAFGAARDNKVFVYRRSSSGWTPHMTIEGPDDSSFGASIDIAGSYMAIAMPRHEGSGGVRVYWYGDM